MLCYDHVPKTFSAACETVGSTRGEKTAWIAHFLGGKNVKKCRHTPQEATDEAQRQKDSITAAKKDGDTESSTQPTANMKRFREENDSDSDVDSDELLPVRSCVKIKGAPERKKRTARRLTF